MRKSARKRWNRLQLSVWCSCKPVTLMSICWWLHEGSLAFDMQAIRIFKKGARVGEFTKQIQLNKVSAPESGASPLLSGRRVSRQLLTQMTST